jgi:diadenosine tetraphosphate (Ap4A) HIT family hydrolase
VSHVPAGPVSRRRIDFEAVRRELGGRCFVCELLAGNPDYAHHVVYEDETAIAFLERFQMMFGYVLVAPKDHRERVVDDFTEDEYAELQRVVHRVGRAVSRAVPTERLYVLSLGSQEGSRHVHWHLAPLPPGVPFEQQQLAALDTDLGLDLSEEELAALAERIRGALGETGKEPPGA